LVHGTGILIELVLLSNAPLSNCSIRLKKPQSEKVGTIKLDVYTCQNAYAHCDLCERQKVLRKT
jgi:hypothetical protein